MKANAILALNISRAGVGTEHETHDNMGRKILALNFLNPAIMQQGIQFSIMLIYIANMPVDSSTDECDELGKEE